MIRHCLTLASLILSILSASTQATESAVSDLSGVLNYRAYSPTFASAGQPTREQFALIRDAGFERVVYIAFSDGGQAIADEDVVVKGLGMRYLHIPVVWSDPLPEEFETFAAFMRQAPDAKTLLHCQVNARATAFSFLYRVIYEDVPVAEAKADMNTVWQPNQTWRDFIFAVLERHGRSPLCDGCDWTPSTAG
ncbi:MAG: protein tyrosine phosphatase family protein [Pseudomonadales bacterium]